MAIKKGSSAEKRRSAEQKNREAVSLRVQEEGPQRALKQSSRRSHSKAMLRRWGAQKAPMTRS